MEMEEIFRRYFQDVYLYIRRLSGSEQVAEEITGETFFKALRSIDRFRGECDIRVWLCQIAKTAIIPTEKRLGGMLGWRRPVWGTCRCTGSLDERLADGRWRPRPAGICTTSRTLPRGDLCGVSLRI